MVDGAGDDFVVCMKFPDNAERDGTEADQTGEQPNKARIVLAVAKKNMVALIDRWGGAKERRTNEIREGKKE